MKILQVIHGYPPHYTAGSEVYTYNLANELTKHAEVFVFTRIENPFEEPYAVSDDVIKGVYIRRVNKPGRDYTIEDKYLDSTIDERFRECLQEVQPDVVHVGHLSHLSTNIVNIAKKEFGLPVVFTVHDFWMFCFRGQAIKPDQQLCPAPSDEGCLACAREKFKDQVNGTDMECYREHMQRVRDNIDLFLSPSCCLKDYFEANGTPPDRICYSRYGFDRSTISFKKKHYEANKENIDKSYNGWALVDNGGDNTIGENRLMSGVDINSLLGEGDKLSLFGLITSESLMSGKLSYAYPLSWNNLIAEASYIHTNYTLDEPFPGATGIGTVSSIEGKLTYPIINSKKEIFNLSLSLSRALIPSGSQNIFW